MKKILQIEPIILALKLDEGRVLGRGVWLPPLWTFFKTIFLTMKMTFNLSKFWYEVREYKSEFVKKIHDNITKENVTVTSSNISQNDGTIRILKILKS